MDSRFRGNDCAPTDAATTLLVVSQFDCRAAPRGGLAGARPGPTSHIRTLPHYSSY